MGQSLLGRLWNKARAALAPTTGSRIIATGRTSGGVYVDGDTAMKDATVWACIQYLTRTVAQLPWRAGQETASGGFKVAPTHAVDYLLHKRPCADMGSFNWRQTMLGWALRYGNAYAEIEWDVRGMAYALWPIHPHRVQPRRAADGRLEYEVWNDAGGSVTIAASDIFHIRGFGEGPVGLSVVEYAAESIGWARATQIFGATYFGEGMNPSGVVSTKKTLTQPAMEVLRGELEGLYKGPKGKRTVILDNDMTFTKVAASPDDSQFIETRQHQVEEICRWFGVPPHKVMHLLRATFSNIEHQSIEVVVDSVMPWVKVFEEEADYKLFGPTNRQGFITKMNLKGLLRGDAQSRAEFYYRMFQTGAMTPNDIMGAEDLESIGPKGDTRFVPSNMQTLEHAIEGGAADPAQAGADPSASADPLHPDAPPKSARRGRNGAILQH